jgi:hypothetical protein
VDGVPIVATGAVATHQIACFNPPLPDEAVAGRPLRAGFASAPPPQGVLDQLALRLPDAGADVGADDLEEILGAIEADEGTILPYPGAAGLPVPPESEHRHDGT